MRSGDRIYFRGSYADAGDELWALPVAALPAVDPPPCEPTPAPTQPPDPPTPGPFECPHGPRCTVLEVGHASGRAGDRITLAITLHARDLPVAGVQSDITFPPGIDVLPDANGAPACSVEPDIDKDATVFAFLPTRCTPGEDCTGMRAIVLSLENVDPIADGSVLYRCTALLSPDLEPGKYALTLGNLGASDPSGVPVVMEGIDGVISVDFSTASRPLAESVADAQGCQTAPPSAPPQSLIWALLALLGLRAAERFRRRVHPDAPRRD